MKDKPKDKIITVKKLSTKALKKFKGGGPTITMDATSQTIGGSSYPDQNITPRGGGGAL